MLEITPTFSIDERELHLDFIRSAGPGGQNVNKVATAVQLRFDIANSQSLAPDLKGRLIRLSGNRVNADGVLLIEARRFRTQEQNREDALRRFAELVRKALVPPKPRKKTMPTAASKTQRLKSKKAKGSIKRLRQDKSFEE
jgi:ribosome-associated protein